ncbi:hypothetical protein CMV30_17085 [Nibricoccus aquaticus]|uniref:Peptidoglycan glycosyltransferase n=1 Tax=Nibricoccus aquaticus TaxID=2576891 RepID=A0A290QAH6_9BACT|nr:penicillin-binding transpeptidase domain-containing protein [Nibricoccus aquaticus]ATC65524.1 hypothetical protein CMV30_17085 [Nibricoccus aquaticus]
MKPAADLDLLPLPAPLANARGASAASRIRTSARPIESNEGQSLAPRLRLLRFVLAAALLTLLAAIARHQLFRSNEYSAAAERQSLRRLLEPAPRGRILDREGRVLADTTNRISASIDLGKLHADLTRDQRLQLLQSHLDRLNHLLARPASTLDAARLTRHLARSRVFPFTLIETLTSAEAARLTSALASDDIIRLQRTPTRTYPHGSLAAHLLGRVRNEPIQITSASDSDLHTLAATELTGESGLEKLHDTLLAGSPVETTRRVNALGYTVATPLSTHASTPGRDLTLSLNLDLQRATETALDAATGSSRGSAVAIDIRTGEILALVSRPGFDLNAVSPSISAATKQQLDASGAWLNRATQALYPPGSTLKIFTVLAGFRSGALNPDTAHRCDGWIQIGNRRFPCHNSAGHGTLTLNRALAHSCNIFAARTGLAAGPNALAAEARRFHFDSPTAIDLPSETTRSLIPDPAWKKSKDLGPWTDGDTVNLAIGQGFLRISPLQAACAMASLARRETLTVPTLLRQLGRNPTGDLPREPLDISDANYTALLTSLRNVVASGIGSEAQVPGITIAGKTGTAQIDTTEGRKNIAWFLAFAPAEKPEIALAIALEGDSPNVEYAGAHHAAPIAREILSAYFGKHITP